MRYELTEYEWSAIKPMLPNRPRGVPRVNDQRVLNGILWVLRSGAPWRDLPESYGPPTTCYSRFVRWRLSAFRWRPFHGYFLSCRLALFMPRLLAETRAWGSRPRHGRAPGAGAFN